MSSPEALLGLLESARRAGVRISPAETLDAFAAVREVGLSDRDTLHFALRATVAKSVEELEVFDDVFRRFFSGRAAALSEQDGSELQASDRAALEEALQKVLALDAEAASRTAGALTEEEGAASSLLGAASRLDFSTLQSSMQVGLFAQRLLRETGFESVERSLGEMSNVLRERVGEARAEVLRRTLSRSLRRAEALARRLAREELGRRQPRARERFRRARVQQTRFGAMDRAQLDEALREARRLGDRLRGRLDRRRRRGRQGRLDLRRTLRRAPLGVPFAPVMRRRRVDKPRLVVVVDVSDSVRSAARFFLVLAQALQRAFASTRTVLFVRDVADATPLFAEVAPEEALDRVARGEVLPLTSGSDYGYAFGRLEAEHRLAFNPRTTWVILGDGRSNHLDPNVGAFQALASRCRRVVWLNPEIRQRWGTGDSAMPMWSPFIDHALVVSNLRELAVAVDELLPRGSL